MNRWKVIDVCVTQCVYMCVCVPGKLENASVNGLIIESTFETHKQIKKWINSSDILLRFCWTIFFYNAHVNK